MRLGGGRSILLSYAGVWMLLYPMRGGFASPFPREPRAAKLPVYFPAGP